LPNATLYAPRFGLAFRYSLSKEVGFLQDAEILPNVTGDSRVLSSPVSTAGSRRRSPTKLEGQGSFPHVGVAGR